MTVADLTAEQRKSLDIQGGVVIKEVQDGPAAVIGLRPGDVITHLDNKAVTSTKVFADVAKALPKNRSVSMRVLRQGRASFITFAGRISRLAKRAVSTLFMPVNPLPA